MDENSSERLQTGNETKGKSLNDAMNMDADAYPKKPYVRIIEQPARFLYESEGQSIGSILGLSSTPDNPTYPTIQVCNYRGQAVVVASCVTKDFPYRPHPHSLVGKDEDNKGVCTIVIDNPEMMCSFTSMGIQCVKRKEIEEALKLREAIKVDPFRTGFAHKNHQSNIDLSVVRLCFQVFIEGPDKEDFTTPLEPVISDPIYVRSKDGSSKEERPLCAPIMAAIQNLFGTLQCHKRKSSSIYPKSSHRPMASYQGHDNLCYDAHDDSCLDIFNAKSESQFVQLTGYDFTGLGFSICGNMKDGIYVKHVHSRGPAIESGKIQSGDRIRSVCISFDGMVYEDAKTILSTAAPYNLVIEVQKSPYSGQDVLHIPNSATLSKPVNGRAPRPLSTSSMGSIDPQQYVSVPLVHPLYRSHSIESYIGPGSNEMNNERHMIGKSILQAPVALVQKFKKLGKSSPTATPAPASVTNMRPVNLEKQGKAMDQPRMVKAHSLATMPSPSQNEVNLTPQIDKEMSIEDQHVKQPRASPDGKADGAEEKQERISSTVVDGKGSPMHMNGSPEPHSLRKKAPSPPTGEVSSSKPVVHAPKKKGRAPQPPKMPSTESTSNKTSVDSDNQAPPSPNDDFKENENKSRTPQMKQKLTALEMIKSSSKEKPNSSCGDLASTTANKSNDNKLNYDMFERAASLNLHSRILPGDNLSQTSKKLSVPVNAIQSDDQIDQVMKPTLRKWPNPVPNESYPSKFNSSSLTMSTTSEEDSSSRNNLYDHSYEQQSSYPSMYSSPTSASNLLRAKQLQSTPFSTIDQIDDEDDDEAQLRSMPMLHDLPCSPAVVPNDQDKELDAASISIRESESSSSSSSSPSPPPSPTEFDQEITVSDSQLDESTEKEERSCPSPPQIAAPSMPTETKPWGEQRKSSTPSKPVDPLDEYLNLDIDDSESESDHQNFPITIPVTQSSNVASIRISDPITNINRAPSGAVTISVSSPNQIPSFKPNETLKTEKENNVESGKEVIEISPKELDQVMISHRDFLIKKQSTSSLGPQTGSRETRDKFLPTGPTAQRPETIDFESWNYVSGEFNSPTERQESSQSSIMEKHAVPSSDSSQMNSAQASSMMSVNKPEIAGITLKTGDSGKLSHSLIIGSQQSVNVKQPDASSSGTSSSSKHHPTD